MILRPIKPEDEPMWHELLASCSTQSIWFRFQLSVQADDARNGESLLLYRLRSRTGHRGRGRGRRRAEADWRGAGSWADAEHDAAEYAVIVVDRWRTGTAWAANLPIIAWKVAKRWGVKRVVAETSKDNTRMLATFRNRGLRSERRGRRGRGPGQQAFGLTPRREGGWQKFLARLVDNGPRWACPWLSKSWGWTPCFDSAVLFPPLAAQSRSRLLRYDSESHTPRTSTHSSAPIRRRRFAP